MKIATDGDFEGMDFLILLIAVVLILLNIILYVMIYQLQSLLKSQYELRLMRERIDFERSRIDEANLIWENIRKTKHDLKNHFAVIKGKLDAGEGESCKEYINQIYATVENMGNLIRSGNSIIDYLINSKLSGVENVNVIISGYVGDYDDIEDVDLASIIGNILDNAVEAQKHVDSEKSIMLHFCQNKSNRVIICKNTIAVSVLKNNKNLESTKESPELHGLGHQIVETTVEKYHGWIDYFEEDDLFGVQIILPPNSKSIK